MGIIYYLKKNNEKATYYLQRGTLRNFIAASMLATIYFKNKEYDKMKNVLNKAIKYSKRKVFYIPYMPIILHKLMKKIKPSKFLQGFKKSSA